MKKMLRDIIHHIGDDPDREGLQNTPERIMRSWEELFCGYSQKAEDIFTTFESDGYDQIVLLADIELYSMCVVGSTFVETPRGRIPISKLKDGDWVYSYNEKAGGFELEKCRTPKITRKKADLVRVYTEKDTILCTPEHKFLCDTGWVKAEKLKNGDSIVSLNRGAIKVNGKHRPHLNFKDGQVSEHRFVFGQVYGEKTVADSKAHIHHIDLNPANNDPSNLKDLDKSSHSSLHAKLDGRGKRESPRLKNQANDPDFQAKRKAGLEAVHNDPKRRKAMLDKRSESVHKSWPARKLRRNINHKVLMVEPVTWKEDVWCMVVPRNKNFVANGMVVHNCEHHMLPFIGKAHIAYIPEDRVVGISKLARLLEIFSRRLQIQERIGEQITGALMEFLQPKGAACIIEADHFCIRMRGVGKQHSTMITSSVKGIFMEDVGARTELLSLIQNKRSG